MGLVYLPFLFVAMLSSMVAPAIAGIVTNTAAGQRVNIKTSALIGAGIGLVFYAARYFLGTGIGVVIFFLAFALPLNFDQAHAFLDFALMSTITSAVAGAVIAALSGNANFNLRKGLYLGGSFSIVACLVIALTRIGISVTFTDTTADGRGFNGTFGIVVAIVVAVLDLWCMWLWAFWPCGSSASATPHEARLRRCKLFGINGILDRQAREKSGPIGFALTR